VGSRPTPATDLAFARGDTRASLKWREDYVAWSPRAVETASLSGAELVFAGYGVQAPEFGWDDFKDVDVTGKVIVVLVNDPPVPDPADASRLDARVFGGRAMTYYGRWTYKYEIGAAKKAAGVLVVHEAGPAGYGWNVVKGFGDERFAIRAQGPQDDQVLLQGWITSDVARRLFAMAGQDYEAQKRAAVSRTFRPVPLGVTASIALRAELRNVESRNVIARLDGRDPDRRNEYIVYTAHWDHLGVGEPVDGDAIRNGAVDNATGTVALVELARTFTKLPEPPARSVVFVAVTGEEQGLLGSEYYARHPVYPLATTLANINMDAMNVHGRTKDITVIGFAASDLDEVARAVAAEQGRVLAPDPEPQNGSYYRSDHFNFARLGVPAFYANAGVDYVGKPAGYAQKVRDEYRTRRYHGPRDEVQPDWDLSGMVEDLKFMLGMGVRLAEADRWPEWAPGNEFKARRDAMLRK
jgi:Zn-dependent M28 family amino/carboxypeptidase